jgi:hypothetical protein
MNERIKELIPRPWTFPYPDREMYSREQMEHLAELIVRKCLELAHDEHKMALEYEWDNDDTATSIRESISKHFGVEE